MNNESDQVRAGDPPPPPAVPERNPYDISWWWFFAVVLGLIVGLPLCALLYAFIFEPDVRRLILLRLAIG